MGGFMTHVAESGVGKSTLTREMVIEREKKNREKKARGGAGRKCYRARGRRVDGKGGRKSRANQGCKGGGKGKVERGFKKEEVVPFKEGSWLPYHEG